MQLGNEAFKLNVSHHLRSEVIRKLAGQSIGHHFCRVLGVIVLSLSPTPEARKIIDLVRTLRTVMTSKAYA